MTVNSLARSNATSEDDGRTKKYHVLMELGRGGAGIVSAAISQGIGGFRKLVVLKTTKPDLIDLHGDSETSGDTAKLLLKEARLSARMQHPNIVQVYEVYEEAGLPVIVMEHLDGLSLAKIMPRLARHDSPEVDLAVTVVCRVLEALSYAHSLTDFGGQPLGIVHRDVSPHNVMITYDGQVKLLDFGTAKLKNQSHETRSGVIKGKLGYMPPEQVCGIPLDGRADVFAVGVVLWELLARRRLWANLSEAEIIRQLLSDKIPSLSDAAPGVDPRLLRICAKALAPQAEDRYESADALLTDLQGYLGARGGAVSESVIADLVGRICGDLRQAAQQRMEQELAKFSRHGEESWDDTDPPEPSAAAQPEDDSGEITARALPLVARAGRGNDVSEAETLTRERRPAPRRKALWWVVAGAVVLGAGGWALARQQGWPLPGTASLAAAPVSAAPLDSQPELEPADIRISVSAEPVQARVYLDGQLAANPYQASHARDTGVHELRVEADGYVPIVRAVRFDADQDLVFSLSAAPIAPEKTAPTAEERPSPTPVRKKPRTSRVASKPAATVVEKPAGVEKTAAPEKAPAPDCDPPHYVDEHGIKRYKRECLGR